MLSPLHTEAARSRTCRRPTGWRLGPEPPRHTPGAALLSTTPAWLIARKQPVQEDPDGSCGIILRSCFSSTKPKN